MGGTCSSKHMREVWWDVARRDGQQSTVGQKAWLQDAGCSAGVDGTNRPWKTLQAMDDIQSAMRMIMVNPMSAWRREKRKAF